MLRVDDHSRRWWILSAVGGVLGLIVLDETVVGVALPTIRRDLGMSLVSSHWVVNAYLLVLTCLVAAGGKLADLVDIRRIFIAGLAIFGLASLASGLAESGAAIITSRGIQGIGAAIVFPVSLAMITKVFPPEQRGLAFGIQTTVGTIFLALGPLVGGVLTHVASWRWIFWVNLPVVVAIAVVVLAAWVPSIQTGGHPRFDIGGLITLLLAIGALVLGAMQGVEWGWFSLPTLGLLIGGAVMTAIFTVIELRASAPLIEVALFRSGPFTAGNLMVYTAQCNKIAMFVFVALYLQDVLRMSALHAGSALLLAVLPAPFTSRPAGRLTDRFGPRWVSLGGLLLNASALLWIGLAVPSRRFDMLVAPFLLWGAALSVLFVAARHMVMNAVAPEKQGQAGGINLTAQFSRRYHWDGGLRHATVDHGQLRSCLPGGRRLVAAGVDDRVALYSTRGQIQIAAGLG
ncbi:MAG TPA: MFS transporter [Candidatus Binatia bacterium]|nr:MFS transporter [Candidatus Binatia bacterium]